MVYNCGRRIKKAREPVPCLSRCLGLRIARLYRISNANAHADDTRQNAAYQSMDEDKLLYRDTIFEVAKFKQPQIKRSTRLFNMSLYPTRLPIRSIGCSTMQRYNYFPYCQNIFPCDAEKKHQLLYHTTDGKPRIPPKAHWAGEGQYTATGGWYGVAIGSETT